MVEEHVLTFIKPDGYVRRYTGARYVKELLKLDLSFEYFREIKPNKEFMREKHYAEHKGKPIFEWLINYVTSTPIIAMIVSGDGIAEKIRAVLGATLCEKADPSSIRGKYGVGLGVNVAHSSENAQVGEKEVSLWKTILTVIDGADYKEKAIDYVNTYENYPIIDAQRYRETGADLKAGKIDKEEARNTFKYFIAQETDIDIGYTDDLVSSIVENFLR